MGAASDEVFHRTGGNYVAEATALCLVDQAMVDGVEGEFEAI